jgi:hypothetical protein
MGLQKKSVLKLQDCLINLPNHHTKRKYFKVKLSCQNYKLTQEQDLI